MSKVMQKKNYTMQEFCDAWEAAESPQEVADRFGIPVPRAMAVASSYRTQYGRPLKKFKKGRPPTLRREAANMQGMDQDWLEIMRLHARLRVGCPLQPQSA